MSLRILSTNKLSTRRYNSTNAIVLVKGSVYIPSGDYLRVPASSSWAFSGDHTIEAWVKPTTTPSQSGEYEIWSTGGAGATDQLIAGTNGVMYWGGYIGTAGSSSATPINTWTHIAVCRSGSTVRFFCNGVQTGSSTLSGTIGSSVNQGYIGRRGDGEFPFVGYMSNLRISSTARYTSNFTPATTTLPTDSYTKLLTCVSANTISDISGNNVAITVGGSCAASAQSPF